MWSAVAAVCVIIGGLLTLVLIFFCGWWCPRHGCCRRNKKESIDDWESYDGNEEYEGLSGVDVNSVIIAPNGKPYRMKQATYRDSNVITKNIIVKEYDKPLLKSSQPREKKSKGDSIDVTNAKENIQKEEKKAIMVSVGTQKNVVVSPRKPIFIQTTELVTASTQTQEAPKPKRRRILPISTVHLIAQHTPRAIDKNKVEAAPVHNSNTNYIEEKRKEKPKPIRRLTKPNPPLQSSISNSTPNPKKTVVHRQSTPTPIVIVDIPKERNKEDDNDIPTNSENKVIETLVEEEEEDIDKQKSVKTPPAPLPRSVSYARTSETGESRPTSGVVVVQEEKKEEPAPIPSQENPTPVQKETSNIDPYPAEEEPKGDLNQPASPREDMSKIKVNPNDDEAKSTMESEAENEDTEPTKNQSFIPPSEPSRNIDKGNRLAAQVRLYTIPKRLKPKYGKKKELKEFDKMWLPHSHGNRELNTRTK